MATNTEIAPRPSTGVAEQNPVLASFEAFLLSSADVMDALGTFVAQTGIFEKSTGITMEAMGKAMLNTDMGKLLEAMGPEVAPLFVKVSLRVGVVNNTDPNKLSPEERIQFGQLMKELASDMRRLIEAVKSSTQQQRGA